MCSGTARCGAGLEEEEEKEGEEEEEGGEEGGLTVEIAGSLKEAQLHLVNQYLG